MFKSASNPMLDPGRLSRTGVLFAVLGLVGLAMPFVQVKANRIVAGEAVYLPSGLNDGLGIVLALILLIVAFLGLLSSLAPSVGLSLGVGAMVVTVATLGLSADALTPEGNRMIRVSPASGFWVLLLAFAMMAADAVTRMAPSIKSRWMLLFGGVVVVVLILSTGLLDHTSVMIEYAARKDLFIRSLWQHLTLAFGSLLLAIICGLPLGILVFKVFALRRAVLSLLNLMQTIPSLALFGIMIPVFGWIAANVPGAAEMGVAGIGLFPAVMALFFYSLLPIVSNTLVGLTGIDPGVRDAAFGLGLTSRQVLFQVQLPLAFPVVLAAIRIVLVQNIGLAVIAGLIGGGGFGSFVFQGLNQTAMDLILLGAVPTIFLAMIAGIGLDLLVEGFDRSKRSA